MRIKKIAQILKKRKITIAVAESCTGGLISKFLTDISGSSKYFKLGIVAYSNEAKNKLLKIPLALLKSKGAVSKEVTTLMAKNVRNIVGATRRVAPTDIGLGITGIAGPGGGTRQKPVGLVYIAASSARKTLVKKLNLKGNRRQTRQQAAEKAINLMAKLLNC